MSTEQELEVLRQAIRAAALDPSVINIRMDLAHFAANTFRSVAEELHMFGHSWSPDRESDTSPFGHGNDAAVAVSMILRIGAQLVSGSADLINDGRRYAGTSLVRQLVEVEYLAWAFEKNGDEAAAWLRSNRQERLSFFAPAKLRKAADGHFRSADYVYHCELGGHPVPGSWRLLGDDTAVAQLMLSDCLGHSGRVWDHVVGWAKNSASADIVLPKQTEMVEKYSQWKMHDHLTVLPPPPDPPPGGI